MNRLTAPSRCRWRVAVLVAVSAACLLLGSLLIVRYVQSIPPDPAGDDPQRVVAWFLSDHFGRLGNEQRQRYVRAMVGRYASMTDDQRRLVDEEIGRQRQNDRGRFRDRMVEMWKGFIVSEAEQYLALPPEQRGPWLEQRVAMWHRLGGPGNTDRAERRGDHMNRALTEERQVEVVTFFQQEVLPRTTARDRAAVTLLVRDAAPYFRR